jgi:excisionase family DNA binding protein
MSGRRPTLMKVGEVADALRLSRMTIYRLIHADEIAHIRVGRSFRIPRTEVDKILRSQQ